MKKIKLHSPVAAFLLCLLISACTTNLDDFSPQSSVETVDNILGKKLQNPYSLDAMRAAYQKVYPSTRSAELADSLIQPNFLYVRFLPKDSTDVRVLFAEDIELYNYPLDYEILGDPSDYHDPSVPIDEITWQYTVIPIDQPLPSNVQCEVIEECFIPTAEMSGPNAQLNYFLIENRSYYDTGNNESYIGGGGSGGASTTSYHGRITVYDDTKGFVGVKGIKVRARNFLKIRTGYTNEEGRYNIAGMRDLTRTPRYELRFENTKGFKMGYGVALVLPMTSSMEGSPNYSIRKSSTLKTWALATINNAAYDWFKYCSDNNIQTPPSDLYIWAFSGLVGASCPMLHHGTFTYTGLNDALLLGFVFTGFQTWYAITEAVLMALVHWIGPDITICEVEIKNSSDIYEYVCHELAHASHFQKLGNDVQKASWWADVVDYEAACIATTKDNDPYLSDNVSLNKGKCGVTEMWAHSMGYFMRDREYSLTDTVYPGHSYWFKPEILWDLFKGELLTPKQVSNCLTRDIDTSLKLKDKLISTYPSQADTIQHYYDLYKPTL